VMLASGAWFFCCFLFVCRCVVILSNGQRLTQFASANFDLLPTSPTNEVHYFGPPRGAAASVARAWLASRVYVYHACGPASPHVQIPFVSRVCPRFPRLPCCRRLWPRRRSLRIRLGRVPPLGGHDRAAHRRTHSHWIHGQRVAGDPRPGGERTARTGRAAAWRSVTLATVRSLSLFSLLPMRRSCPYRSISLSPSNRVTRCWTTRATSATAWAARAPAAVSPPCGSSVALVAGTIRTTCCACVARWLRFPLCMYSRLCGFR